MNHNCLLSDIATYGASTRPDDYIIDPGFSVKQQPGYIPSVSPTPSPQFPEIVPTTETVPPGKNFLDRFEIKELIAVGLLLSALSLLKR